MSTKYCNGYFKGKENRCQCGSPVKDVTSFSPNAALKESADNYRPKMPSRAACWEGHSWFLSEDTDLVWVLE